MELTWMLCLLAPFPRIELAPPFLVKVNGAPLTVDRGHAAPVFKDWDGDGLPDLLVGQFEGGLLRIYKNIGKPGQPEFKGFVWFEVEGKPASVEWG